MSEQIDVQFESGSIQVISKLEARPATSKKPGNATTNYAALTEVPEHFIASFYIGATCTADGISIRNALEWSCAVLGLGRGTPYREVELQAARRVAPMLRSVADQIEKDVAQFDAQVGDAKKRDE